MPRDPQPDAPETSSPSYESSPVAAAAWIVAAMAAASLAAAGPLEEAPDTPAASRMYDARPREPPTPSAAAQVARVRDGGKIDVDTADASTLQLLPGVGPAIAQRILADRVANGPYGELCRLTRVRGIGPRTVQRIARVATASGRSPGGEEVAETEGHPGVEAPVGVVHELEGEVSHPRVDAEGDFP